MKLFEINQYDMSQYELNMYIWTNYFYGAMDDIIQVPYYVDVNIINASFILYSFKNNIHETIKLY
jgi:hypothetical protein